MCGRCRAGATECIYDESSLAWSSTFQSASSSQMPSSASTSLGRVEEARPRGLQLDRSYPLAGSAAISQINDPSSTTEPPTKHARLERGQVSVFDGGRSSYTGSTYWANAIPSEVPVLVPLLRSFGAKHADLRQVQPSERRYSSWGFGHVSKILVGYARTRVRMDRTEIPTSSQPRLSMD
jgi:hypothetical protein